MFLLLPVPPPVPSQRGCPTGPRPGAGRDPADPGNRLVGKVLTGNGITRYANGACSLVGGDVLSDSERLESECRA